MVIITEVEETCVQESNDSSFAVGTWVRVVGLQAKPELNGVTGVLESFLEEKDRWAVKLNQQGAGTKLLKASNLSKMSDGPLAFAKAGAEAAGRADKFAAAAAKVQGGVEVAQEEAIKMQVRRRQRIPNWRRPRRTRIR